MHKEKFQKCIAFVITIVYNIDNNIDTDFSLKGVLNMAKTANLYARIEPDIKEQAECILAALGIPASNAITMFYKQIILHKGLPFQVKLPDHPLNISNMSSAELDAELEKGYADMEAGRTIPVETALADIRKELGL